MAQANCEMYLFHNYLSFKEDLLFLIMAKILVNVDETFWREFYEVVSNLD